MSTFLLKSRAELHRPAPEAVVAENGVHWLRIPGWEKFSWLKAGFSTRKGGRSRIFLPEGCPANQPGELNLGLSVGDDREVVLTNRRLLVEAIAGEALPLIALKQIHSCKVLHSSVADASRTQPEEADGHFTRDANLMLAAQTADCIPVLVADTRQQIVAAYHAGWRGTVQRIVELGVNQLQAECASKPEDLIAAIGPGAGPCCYSIGREVIESFTSNFAYASELFFEVSDPQPNNSNLHLDLIEANRRQLLAAGLAPEAIHLTGGCTHCRQDLFFSHRGSGGHAGRMMAVIARHLR